ncbi:MAG: phosphate ABC transporter permease PstA [Natronomonas sp.]
MSTPSEDELFDGVDLDWEHKRDRAFRGLCFLASVLGLVALAFLIADVIWESYRGIVEYDIGIIHFLTSNGSVNPDQAGMYAALIGSIWLIVLAALLTFFVGVGAAIYLEEYAPDNRWVRLIDANLANLAGVPSVVYGLVCLGLLVNGPLDTGRIILVGAISLSLVVLPIIIVSSIEALRAVPDSVRNGSYAMGATRWQTVRRAVLPAAMPSIMTGTILAVANAWGQTAPLLMVGALASARHTPQGPFDDITALTVTIFDWAFRFQDQFHVLAAMGIVGLLVVLLSMNLIAIYIRNRYEKELK